MNKIKILFLTAILIIPLQLISQVHEEWDVRYRAQTDDYSIGRKVKYDSYGNVYVLGSSMPNNFLILLKYNSRGELQWDARIQDTYPVEFSLDNYGNIYVCGNGYNGGIIRKYSSFGITQWEAGRAFSIYDMTVDDFGNVYITGYGFDGNNSGIQTVKYNTSGSLLWAQYLTSGSSGCSGYKIKLDEAGNVYTLAKYVYSGINSIKVLKYNNNGQLQWAGTTSQYFDIDYYGYASLGIDSYGSVYCSGTGGTLNTKSDYIITKFSNTGTEIWYRTYNSEYNLDDRPQDMEVTEDGDIYITGYSLIDTMYNSKVTTIKYDSTGQMKWKKDFTTVGNYTRPRGIATDIFKNIYLTIRNSYGQMITTIKYDTSGTQKWIIDYIGVTPSSEVYDISADNYGNIYLSGSTSAAQHVECLTIRYLQSWNSNFTITGCIKYKDNSQPVEGGYIKAVKLDRSNGNIITVDSTPILISGYYSLKKIPQDSVYLIAFPPSNQSFAPAYYPQGIYWKSAQKIFATSNLSEVNINVDRQATSSGNCTVKGKIMKAENKNVVYIKDAMVYIKSEYGYLKNSVSDGNGMFQLNSVQQGSVKLLVDRLGFSADSISMTLSSGNTYENINFYLNQIYVSIKHFGNTIPEGYELGQNYPNPFNANTIIRFQVSGGFLPSPRDGNDKVVLKVYDLMGREVRTLVNEFLKSGTYEVRFDAGNLPSGIYFYRMETEKFTETKKLILIK